MTAGRVDKQLSKLVASLMAQARQLYNFLDGVGPDDFERDSILPGWDVRTLTGHLVLSQIGTLRLLDQPAEESPLPAADFISHYRRDVAAIDAAAGEFIGDHSGQQLTRRLRRLIPDVESRLTGPLPRMIDTPRGPVRTRDFLRTRVVELVVHADDLSRSLADHDPVVLDRNALGDCTRTLAELMAERHPGRSLEVRMPPFAAVQCGTDEPGPTHTRGTPPNVVETDPLTFIRLATGRLPWAEARALGIISASGTRADLSGLLPVLQ